MATYYWVGGTGTWDNATNTKWASTSGGAGGAGIPTSADDVIFNSASNATGYTVTVGTGAVCKSMTVNGPASGTVTFSGSATWTFYGSITLAATGVSINCSCPVTFAATTTGNTITTNGVGFSSGSWTFSGSGDYTLGSALSLSAGNQVLYVTAGTFSTGNYNVTTIGGFSFSGGTINLGSSTITPAAFYASFVVGGTATLNAGTSTLNMNGSNGGVDVGGRTLYNVNFFSMSQSNFTSAATMNNLTIDLASGGGTLTLYANITVTGTFSTINATNAAVRVYLRSNTTTARTITAAATSLNDIDFYYITAAGVASPFTGSRLSDFGGNSNITFSAPKTVYWNLSGSRSWTAIAWANTSGGTANGFNYPLIQDTAIIDDAGSANTISINNLSIGSINASSRTLPFTISAANYVNVYGYIKLGSAVSGSLSGYLNFVLSSPTTEVQIPINAATYTFTGNGSSQNVVMIGALSSTNYGVLGEASIRVISAGLITNGYSITAPSVRITSGTQTVDFGNSVITCTGDNIGSGNPEPFNVVSANLLANSCNIVLSSTSNASTRTFAGGGKSYGTLTINGGNANSQTVIINGNNIFNTVVTNKTVPWTLRFAGGSNNSVNTWSISGTSGNVFNLNSTTASLATLTYTGNTYVSFDYANVYFIAGRPANYKWFAGTNSTDSGNNSAVYFSAPFDPTLGNFLLFT